MNYYPHFIDEAIRVQRSNLPVHQNASKKEQFKLKVFGLQNSVLFPLSFTVFKISMEGQWELSAIQVPKLEAPVEIIKNKLSCPTPNQSILSTKYENNETVL